MADVSDSFRVEIALDLPRLQKTGELMKDLSAYIDFVQRAIRSDWQTLVAWLRNTP